MLYSLKRTRIRGGLGEQIGAPSSREQYVHRLGRTGRAGKTGRGVLLLCPYERYFVKDVSDLPLEDLTQGLRASLKVSRPLLHFTSLRFTFFT